VAKFSKRAELALRRGMWFLLPFKSFILSSFFLVFLVTFRFEVSIAVYVGISFLIILSLTVTIIFFMKWYYYQRTVFRPIPHKPAPRQIVLISPDQSPSYQSCVTPIYIQPDNNKSSLDKKDENITHMCYGCRGSGWASCTKCGGCGWSYQSYYGGGTVRVNCLNCTGRGNVFCGRCGGRGSV